MGNKVYDTMIPRNVRISEAPSYGKPVLVYDLKCAGSDAYLEARHRSDPARARAAHALTAMQDGRSEAAIRVHDRKRWVSPRSTHPAILKFKSGVLRVNPGSSQQWPMKRVRDWGAGWQA